MIEREQTIKDMEDMLVRFKALTAQARRYCTYSAYCFLDKAKWLLEQAIEKEKL